MAKGIRRSCGAGKAAAGIGDGGKSAGEGLQTTDAGNNFSFSGRAWETGILCRQLLNGRTTRSNTLLRTWSHNIGICRHTPCFEQPLRHIASVAILCAPTPQLIRRRVVTFGESEPTSLQLKFSGRGGWSQRWFFAAPVRIALFARHCNFQVVVLDEVV